MALKDASQLVKMYAMVNVSQYQIVATGSTVEECQESYAALLQKNGVTEIVVPEAAEQAEITGRIAEIRSAVMDGNTCYFIRLQEEAVYYIINGRDYPIAAVLNVEDKVHIVYEVGEGELLTGVSIERK